MILDYKPPTLDTSKPRRQNAIYSTIQKPTDKVSDIIIPNTIPNTIIPIPKPDSLISDNQEPVQVSDNQNSDYQAPVSDSRNQDQVSGSGIIDHVSDNKDIDLYQEPIPDIEKKDQISGEIDQKSEIKIKKYGKYDYILTHKSMRKKPNFIKAYQETRGNITRSCIASNISRETYKAWITSDPEFRRAIEDADTVLNDEIRDKLIAKAKKEDITSILFYLKKRHPDFQDNPTLLQQFNLTADMKLDIQEDS